MHTRMLLRVEVLQDLLDGLVLLDERDGPVRSDACAVSRGE